VLIQESFTAFGERRGANWAGSPSSADWTQIANTTRRGFTDHEHLDNLNLIHMNGRVYDPSLGRFISADPFIDGWTGTQGYNRYSYVHNNPLRFLDPSGFKGKTGDDDDISEGPGGDSGPDNYINPNGQPIDEIIVNGQRLQSFSRGQPTSYSSYASFASSDPNHPSSMCTGPCDASNGPVADWALPDPAIEPVLLFENFVVVLQGIPLGIVLARTALARYSAGLHAARGVASLPTKPGQLGHIFRNASGHLADTPANRKLLTDVATNPANRIGVDRFGNVWSSVTRADGTQVWVSTRNGVIQNGGLNQVPQTFPNIVGP
jgi:RHS repeat-associated protein